MIVGIRFTPWTLFRRKTRFLSNLFRQQIVEQKKRLDGFKARMRDNYALKPKCSTVAP